MVDIARRLSVESIASVEHIEDRLVRGAQGLESIRATCQLVIDEISTLPDGEISAELRRTLANLRFDLQSALDRAADQRTQMNSAEGTIRTMIATMQHAYTLDRGPAGGSS